MLALLTEMGNKEVWLIKFLEWKRSIMKSRLINLGLNDFLKFKIIRHLVFEIKKP